VEQDEIGHATTIQLYGQLAPSLGNPLKQRKSVELFLAGLADWQTEFAADVVHNPSPSML